MSSKFLKTPAISLCLLCASGARADNHNVTSNTIGNLIGFPNLEYSYKIANHWTFGVRGSKGRSDISDIEVKGSSAGSIVRYYFKPAFDKDSFYLATSIDRDDLKFRARTDSKNFQGVSDETVVAAGAGFHWFWDSFNVSLGALFKGQKSKDLYDEVGNRYKHSVKSVVAIDFTMGGKF